MDLNFTREDIVDRLKMIARLDESFPTDDGKPGLGEMLMKDWLVLHDELEEMKDDAFHAGIERNLSD